MNLKYFQVENITEILCRNKDEKRNLAIGKKILQQTRCVTEMFKKYF